MIRKQEATGKTVDEARAKACALLGVQADDLNVSCEVLEMPQKTGFLGLKLTPAKVCVSVEEPDAPAAPAVEEKKAPVQEKAAPAPAVEAPAAPAEPEAKAEEAAAPAVEAAAVQQPAAEEEETEEPINIEENAKVKAAVDYLREVIALMGVENVSFSAVQKGRPPSSVWTVKSWAPSSAAAARPWRACPIWQALWQTVWRAITSSWVWTLPATATSARAT